MSNNEPPMGCFYDHLTGETIVRELTAEEIAAMQEPENETPTAD